MSATSAAASMTLSCSATTWRRCRPSWRPTGCRARFSTERTGFPVLRTAGVKPWLMGIAVLAASMVPAAAEGWTEQEVSNAELRGTLTLPVTSGSFPAALIIAGSGPVDRNGNFPGAPNDSLKLLAHGLATQGIASLRVDKRGIGGSRAAGMREEDLRFGTYVADAASWLKLLRGQSRVSRVALIGHSEGALIATLVAQQADLTGLILIASAS